MRDRGLLTLHAALLGAWLGASAFVSFAVAPAAFAALPTRSAAGTFVGGLLRVVYAAGLVAGGAGIALAAARGGRARKLRVILPSLVAASAAGSLVLAARIASLRASLGPVDALPPDHPGRRAFGALHGVSVLVLLAGMLAGAAAIAAEGWGGPQASDSSRSRSG